MATDAQTGLIRFIFLIQAFLGCECGQMQGANDETCQSSIVRLNAPVVTLVGALRGGLCMWCVFPITLALLRAALCPCVCLQEQVATGSFLSKHTPLFAYSQTHSISVLFPICTSTSSFLVEFMERTIKTWRS